MKTLLLTTAIMSLNFLSNTGICSSESDGHRGGNGGDVYEIDLQKRMKKIGKFVNSTTGKQVFANLNTQAVEDMAMEADINLTSDLVYDKFEAVRTCTNDPMTSSVLCTTTKLEKASPSTLDTILGHELLGLLNIETGHSDNPSDYPLSQKLASYTSVIDSIMLDDGDVYPEYIGLDNQSYGITYVNKETKESLRMICLNDNVTVNRCKNFSVVRSAQKMQSPLVAEKIVVTPAQLKGIELKNIKSSDVEAALDKIERLQSDGFNYITVGNNAESQCDGYVFGGGAIQALSDSLYSGFYGLGRCYFWQTVVGIIIPFYNIPYLGGVIVDVPTEIAKQAINLTVYPFKAIVSAIKLATNEGIVENYNRRLGKVAQLLNLKNDLSLIGKSKKLSDKDYQNLVNDTINALK